jgi:hypothetical protein
VLLVMVAAATVPAEFPSGLRGVVGITATCAVGSLISHGLKRYGVSSKFPGVGAKTVASLYAMSWVLVAIGFGLDYFLGFR